MIHTRETLVHGAEVQRIMLWYTREEGFTIRTTEKGYVCGGIFKSEIPPSEKILISSTPDGDEIRYKYVTDLLGRDSSVLCVDFQTAKKYETAELIFDPDAHEKAIEHYNELVYLRQMDD